MELPIKKNSSRLSFFAISSISLFAGFLFYALCRPSSAFYALGENSGLEVSGWLNDVTPDFFWGIAFAASLGFFGCGFRNSCLIVTSCGLLFEIWQFFSHRGGAHLNDVIAYTLGSIAAFILVNWPPFQTNKSMEVDRRFK
jgi:VanZ family protein